MAEIDTVLLGVSSCLTLAGLSVRGWDETHVTFTTVASRNIQAVTALTQVHVICTLIAVCTRTHKHIITNHFTENNKQVLRSTVKWNIWTWVRVWPCDLSSRIRPQRIRPCSGSGMIPWCSDSLRCCCTCGSRWNTHPGLKHTQMVDYWCLINHS
jgi:hypothetical protein